MSRTAIGFHEIPQMKFLLVLTANILTWNAGTVFHDDDFKIFEGLFDKTLKQLVHLVRTIENWYDDRVFHGVSIIKWQLTIDNRVFSSTIRLMSIANGE